MTPRPGLPASMSAAARPGRPERGGPTLRLLGEWRLAEAGTEIALPLAGRRLVALVALRGPLSRAEAATTLWPEHPPAHARNLLRRTLSSMAAIVPELIVPEPFVGDLPRLGLTSRLTVDVRALEAVAASATGGGLDLDDVAPAVLCDAPELLPGWYDDWVGHERERLTRLRWTAIVALAERRASIGRVGEALALAENAIHIDPLREEAVAMAIRSHLDMGNPALAVRCYRALRDRLRAEFGVEPGAACRDLLRAYAPLLG